MKSRAPLGGLVPCQAIAFSPQKRAHPYVGDYFDDDLRIFHIVGGALEAGQPRQHQPSGGQPASMRALPH